jgi:hypothetical protein
MTQDTHVTLTLTRLRLGNALRQAGVKDPASVTKLTVAGIITENDFRYIRENMRETLQELDMGGASIKEPTASWRGRPALYYAFYGCTGLTSVILPDSTVEIGEKAFAYCSSLASVFIPKSVKAISKWAFDCPVNVHPDNPLFTSENGILFSKNKTKIIRCPANFKGAYDIPEPVKEIGRDAFCGCEGLTSVTVPASVTKIGDNAFSGCRGLTAVTVHNPAVEIEDYAFAYCTDLTTVNIPPNLKFNKDKVFSGCNKSPYGLEKLKQEKIVEIQKNSAADWIKYLMNDSDYSYQIDEHTHSNKIILKVKITEKQILEIPVYNRNFQKIVPKIMETIKRFETCIKENEIKALLRNAPPHGTNWIHPKN